jgi:hypothetical protein
LLLCAVLAGCAYDGPAATVVGIELATPTEAVRLSTSQNGSATSLSDGVTVLHIESLAGEISIRDASGANAIYLDYDGDLLEELLEFGHGIAVGDHNDEALAVLYPWENSGSEPFRGGLTSSDQSKRTGSSSEVWSHPVVRLASNNAGSRPGIESLGSPSMSFATMGTWSPDCPSIAESIGTHRLNYHLKRGTAFDELRGVQGIPATRLVWRDGKPYVTLQDLRNIYASFGMILAQSAFHGLQLNIMRGMYNGYYCQQPIVVGLPTPGSVHVPNGNGGGGGGAMRCTVVNLQYEISFDGGVTWYPFVVQSYACAPHME